MWTYAIKFCKPYYHSVLFSVPFIVTEFEKREEKKKLFHSARGNLTSVSWNIIQSGGETLQFVHQASIAVLTTAVSINGLLLSVLLLHCVDLVIWVSVQFLYVFHYAEGSSNCIDYYIVETDFSSVNHHISADSYSGSRYGREKKWQNKSGSGFNYKMLGVKIKMWRGVCCVECFVIFPSASHTGQTNTNPTHEELNRHKYELGYQFVRTLNNRFKDVIPLLLWGRKRFSLDLF